MPVIDGKNQFFWSAQDFLINLKNKAFTVKITETSKPDSSNRSAKISIILSAGKLEKTPFFTLPEDLVLETTAVGSGSKAREGIQFSPWGTGDGDEFSELLQLLFEEAKTKMNLPDSVIFMNPAHNASPLFIGEPWRDAKKGKFSIEDYLEEGEGRVVYKFSIYIKTVERTGDIFFNIGLNLGQKKFKAAVASDEKAIRTMKPRVQKRKADEVEKETLSREDTLSNDL